MIGFRVCLGGGIAFALASTIYAGQLPGFGQACLVFALIVMSVLVACRDRQGTLAGIYGIAISLLGVYLFLNSFAYGPGYYGNHLFYSNGPTPSVWWGFLGGYLVWIGLTLAIGGFIWAVRNSIASKDRTDRQEGTDA